MSGALLEIASVQLEILAVLEDFNHLIDGTDFRTKETKLRRTRSTIRGLTEKLEEAGVKKP